MLQHHDPTPVDATPAVALAPPATARSVALTTNERAIIYGLAEGRAPKQLAADRGVALATIRAHIQNAKRKTSARTLNELVAIAIRVRGPVAR